MQRRKEYYKKLPMLNGYKWYGNRKGFHYFIRDNRIFLKDFFNEVIHKNFSIIKCTDNDIFDSDYKYFLTNDLTR